MLLVLLLALIPARLSAISYSAVRSSVKISTPVAEGLVDCKFRKLSESGDETVSLPTMGGLETKEGSVCQNQACWSRADHTHHALRTKNGNQSPNDPC